MFRLHGEAYLSRLDFLPNKVDVLEIYHFHGEPPTINHMSLEETELKRWLTIVPRTTQGQEGQKATAGLRLILGPTPGPRSSPSSVPARYPGSIGPDFLSQVIPFSKSVFKMVIQQFNLPSSTPWAFGTDGSHFQRYNLGDRRGTSPRTGNKLIVHSGVSIDKLS